MTAIYSPVDTDLKQLAYQHILTVEQFTPEVLEALFALAQRMDRQVAAGQVDQLLANRVVANVFVGDLRTGRTVHSLIKLLAIDRCRVSVVCIAPESLSMPDEYVEFARSRQMPVEETRDLQSAIRQVDVLYVTRVQRERFVAQQLEELARSVYGIPFDSLDVARKEALGPVAELNAAQEYMTARDAYVVDPMLLSQARKNMIVMHPLPRVNEIPEEVDSDDRAYYFRQVQNGLHIRMALMAAVLDCLPG